MPYIYELTIWTTDKDPTDSRNPVGHSLISLRALLLHDGTDCARADDSVLIGHLIVDGNRDRPVPGLCPCRTALSPRMPVLLLLSLTELSLLSYYGSR